MFVFNRWKKREHHQAGRKADAKVVIPSPRRLPTIPPLGSDHPLRALVLCAVLANTRPRQVYDPPQILRSASISGLLESDGYGTTILRIPAFFRMDPMGYVVLVVVWDVEDDACRAEVLRLLGRW